MVKDVDSEARPVGNSVGFVDNFYKKCYFSQEKAYFFVEKLR
jgi:hypothetical protein